jgi:hypothetical protein
MAMVIVLFSASLVLTVVTAILLSAAMRTADSSAPLRENPHPTGTPRFFAKDISVPAQPARASRVPVETAVELLVLEIERHVRGEREAAQLFHLSPTPQTLHVAAVSPLMH